ncbi:dihydrolipoamide acetyltransferase family protein [soil metagenome]
MTEHIIKIPDVGEGIAEAEIVELRVKVGDVIREDDVIAAVMTDKATVEIPSPVSGSVSWLGADIGQTVAIGSVLIKIADESGEKVGASDPAPAVTVTAAPPVVAAPAVASRPKQEGEITIREVVRDVSRPATSVARSPGARPMASPYVRNYARERKVDLETVAGTGPAGRILAEDVDLHLSGGGVNRGPQRATGVERTKIIGLRRKIASRLQSTKQRIPHFSYVEEIDVTELESVRATLNGNGDGSRPKLTILPFIVRALVVALREYPKMNSRFEDAEELLETYAGVHVGIAAQTPGGLMVPVLRHAEALSLWDYAGEIRRLGDAAKSGKIAADELSGSTITVTSLGAMGGIVSTPVINSPEVAIIGINKMAIRPVWRDGAFQPRKIMNLSSSFDHRIIDGYDAAEFVQRLRSLLECPTLLFVDRQ